jgi:diguanylate cyclase (GGDEF)-like protein/PAS domain S-box-containing protein
MDETAPDTAFYRELLDGLSEGVYFVDRDRRITYWNRGAERITGRPASEVLGHRCRDNLLVHTDDAGANLCREGCPLLATMEDGIPREAEIYLRHRDGHRVPVLVRSAPIRRHGVIIGAVESFQETTKRMAALEQIRELDELAFVDPLTELPNRRMTEGVLRNRLDELERYGWPLGVGLIDVDGLGRVNERLGHDAGDAVLRMVARTLAAAARPFDVVGRFDADAFLALLPGVDEDRLRRELDRLRTLIARSQLRLASRPVGVTVTCGGVLARRGDSVEGLIGRVERALERARGIGRNLTVTEGELA